MLKRMLVGAGFVLMLSGLLPGLTESAHGEDYPAEVEALILGEFEVLNDARFLNVSVSKADKCFVHKKSAVQVLQDLDDGKLKVLYKPALVFLYGEGRTVNLWDDYKRGGVALCPFGTEMLLDKSMVQQWKADHDMLVLNSSRYAAQRRDKLPGGP